MVFAGMFIIKIETLKVWKKSLKNQTPEWYFHFFKILIFEATMGPTKSFFVSLIK